MQFHLILIENGTGDCKAWRFIGDYFALAIAGTSVLAGGGHLRERISRRRLSIIVNEQRRNEIIYRWHGGQSMRGIARGLRISRKAVERVLATHQTAREGQSVRSVRHARHSKLDEYDEALRNLIARYPHMTVTRLLENLQSQGFQGGYTILRERVKLLRPREEDDLAAATAPGALAEASYNGYDVDFTQEDRRRIYLFEYRLAYSGRQYLRFVPDSEYVTTIALHRRAFDHMGGVAPTCVYGHVDAIMARGPKNVRGFSRSFLAYASYYGFRPLYDERHGGISAERESRLHFVESNLLQGRLFRSLDDLNDATRVWLTEVANLQVQQNENRFITDLYREEASFLIPLPAKPWSGE